MNNIQFQQASPALRTLVRVYAQRDVGAGKTQLVESIPARLEQTLEFQFGDSFDVYFADGSRHAAPDTVVVGAYPLSGCRIALRKGVSSFGIFFQPAGFSQLFGVPIADLSLRFYDARSVLGKSISCLHHQLADERSFPGRVRLAEEFLLNRAARGLVDSCMTRAASDLFDAHGTLRITDLANGYSLGTRQFERRFLRHVGFTPKLFARVARFQTALDLKIRFPQKPWVNIATELGYHDQMHLVHDFHDLAGDAPGLLLSQIGDARPTAMALPQVEPENLFV
jgi:AraC-like DNA-binding protein